MSHHHPLSALAAGTLEPDEAEAVRAHLRGCAPCRDEYDALATTAQAVFGDAAHAGAKARLLATLEKPAVAPAPTRSRWWLALPVAAAASLVAVLVVPRVIRQRELEEITWRGDDGARAPFGLAVYAQGHDGKVRLVANFPGSGEGTVRRGELVQVKAKGRDDVELWVTGASGVPKRWRYEEGARELGGEFGLWSLGFQGLVRKPGVTDAQISEALISGQHTDVAEHFVRGVVVVEP